MLPFKRKLFWGLEYPFKNSYFELLDRLSKFNKMLKKYSYVFKYYMYLIYIIHSFAYMYFD